MSMRTKSGWSSCPHQFGGASAGPDERLDSEANARYKIKKLELAGLALENDPYAHVNQENSRI